MTPLPPYTALFAYFVAFFTLAFAWRSLLVYRRTGINPLVLPSSADAYGYVARSFKLVIAIIAMVVSILAFSPGLHGWLGPYLPLQSSRVAWIGWALLLSSFAWMLIAQSQMGASWRVGIDTQRRTELVQHGLFAISRNPIFLAMRVNLLGLFLISPSAASLAILVAGEILMQVQVRLEEQHLLTMHSALYASYQKKVRRWL